MILYLWYKNNFVILENKKNLLVYIYSKNNYLKLKIKKKNAEIQTEKNTKTISIKFKKFLKKIQITNSILNNIIYSWSFFFFEKIKFNGKGYKIKKSTKKNSLIFSFNRAHINILLMKNNLVKKIKKNKIIIFNTNLVNLKNICQNIIKIRKSNIYTKRGLRLSRCLILKKSSKKTTAT